MSSEAVPEILDGVTLAAVGAKEINAAVFQSGSNGAGTTDNAFNA